MKILKVHLVLILSLYISRIEPTAVIDAKILPCEIPGIFDGLDVIQISSTNGTTCKDIFEELCPIQRTMYDSRLICRTCSTYNNCVDFKIYCNGVKFKGAFCIRTTTKQTNSAMCTFKPDFFSLLYPFVYLFFFLIIY